MDIILRKEVIASVALGGVLWFALQSRGSPKPLPPGPKRLPIVGNALQMNPDKTWLVLSKWAREFGKLVYAEVVGQPFLIINDTTVAKELMDKRSSIYSNRPHLPMGGDLAGFGRLFVLLPLGEAWNNQRKLIASELSTSSIIKYNEIQEEGARNLVSSVLQDNSSLFSQVKLRIAAIIVRVTYGYVISKEEDEYLQLPVKAMQNFSDATEPGKWLVDLVPALKNLPTWMPGAGFLERAAGMKRIMDTASWNPYLYARKNFETGVGLVPNICDAAFQEVEERGGKASDIDNDMVWSTSVVMGGGMDTNMSTVLTFFLEMVLHPDIQAKARAEVDRVIGSDRLPTIKDAPDLPYVRSILVECMRCFPAFPLGIAHAAHQDDIYQDMYIPKGSLVVPNVWYMCHDPAVWTDPDTFNPDRYENKDSEMQKVLDLVFGFGRRICPGRYFAQGTIFVILATTLAVAEILPEVDSTGKDVLPELKYTSGAIITPEPYNCRIKPRSRQRSELLSHAINDA